MGNVSKTTAIKQKSNFKSYFILESEKQVKDNYIISNKLGSGEVGEIRRIISRTSGEEKALKIIPKILHKQQKENNLHAEIDLLRNLDHPCIIKMYEYY